MKTITAKSEPVKITVSIDGTEHILNESEAKKLRDSLDALLADKPNPMREYFEREANRPRLATPHQFPEPGNPWKGLPDPFDKGRIVCRTTVPTDADVTAAMKSR